MQIEFEFRDDVSCGKWVRRRCDVRDLAQAEEIYGLADVEHRWLSIDGKPVQDPSPAEPFYAGGEDLDRGQADPETDKAAARGEL